MTHGKLNSKTGEAEFDEGAATRSQSFPTLPLKIKDNGSCFRVEDADGKRLGHFYYRDEPDVMLGTMTKDEAREAAQALARALSG